ncbi:aminotransferase [Dyella monticola]|uniref:Aminotransferase n=2 Tax=Dyella monticola TaxID=1927958 RepID=A0A370X6K1_9GAMM|nr:aminotransferase [Dyella monticola]
MTGDAGLTDAGFRAVAELCSHRQSNDIDYLERALATGLTGTSPIVLEFEQAIGAVYGVPHVVAVSSGAAAVMAALKGFDWSPGQEVVVSPTCPICTVLPLLQHGLVPVFCDVRPNSFGLCPDDLARLISPKTCAIIEVPMWGYPVAVDETQRIAAEHRIPLVLDLAHAHMTSLRGRYLAHYGDVACFSTHDCKFMSTGEGGFVMSQHEAVASRVRSYTRFGNLDGKSPGINLKMGGLQAALGAARAPLLEQHLAIRQGHRQKLKALLDNGHFRELPVTPGGSPSGYALLLQAIGHDGRDLVRHQVSHGIPSDIHKYDNRPLYEYPLLAKYSRHCPNATSLLRSLTTIPLHPDLCEDDLVHIAHVLNRYRSESIEHAYT